VNFGAWEGGGLGLLVVFSLLFLLVFVGLSSIFNQWIPRPTLEAVVKNRI
jgi:hypothetical protein